MPSQHQLEIRGKRMARSYEMLRELLDADETSKHVQRILTRFTLCPSEIAAINIKVNLEHDATHLYPAQPDEQEKWIKSGMAVMSLLGQELMNVLARSFLMTAAVAEQMTDSQLKEFHDELDEIGPLVED